MAALHELREQWRGDPRQHARLAFDHCDIGADRAGGCRGFQPDVAGADDRETQARPQRRPKTVSVGHRAQFEDAGELVPRHGQHPGARAKRKDQMVVGNTFAGPKRRASGSLGRISVACDARLRAISFEA